MKNTQNKPLSYLIAKSIKSIKQSYSIGDSIYNRHRNHHKLNCFPFKGFVDFGFDI